MIYANNFDEILSVLDRNIELRARVIIMIETKPFCCEILSDEVRADIMRKVLLSLVNKEIKNMDSAYNLVKEEFSKRNLLPENLGVSSDWNKKIVRVNLSRFYNHSLLEQLQEENKKYCFIPEVKTVCKCSLKTNHQYEVDVFLNNLVSCYDMGCSGVSEKVPESPDCPHVVMPVEYMNLWHV